MDLARWKHRLLELTEDRNGVLFKTTVHCKIVLIAILFRVLYGNQPTTTTKRRGSSTKKQMKKVT